MNGLLKYPDQTKVILAAFTYQSQDDYDGLGADEAAAACYDDSYDNPAYDDPCGDIPDEGE